jgi:crossover junction endodeoxyribonuclease RuvC
LKVLGIDPGVAKLGLAVINSETLRVEYSECFTTSSKLPHGDRLWYISQKINDITQTYCPDIAIIEKIFFNQSVTNALKVAESRGVILLELAKREICTAEFTPLQVKLKLTGYGRANKKDVIQKIFEVLGVDLVLKNDDEADGLALGLCYIFDLNENRTLLRKVKKLVNVDLLTKPPGQKNHPDRKSTSLKHIIV